MLSSALKKQLETPKNIVFTAHKGPDGDACGSTIAMAQYFRALGHETTVVLPNAIPKNLRQVFDFESIVSFDNKENLAKRKLKEADILFCLDYNNPSRVGDMEADLVASSAYKVMIDHHLYPKTFCDEQHSFPEVSSTCQLVYRCLHDYGLTSMYTPEIMASLYTGMLTDTGSFRFSSVDAETHYIVYKFKTQQFDHERIHRLIFDQNSVARTQLLGFCLSQKMEILKDQQLGILSLTKLELDQYNCTKQDTEGFVNHLLSLENVEVAAFFIEQANEIKLSLRAVGNWKVNQICSEFYNGGGHQSAAGGQFDGSMEDLISHFKTQVVPQLKRFNSDD